MKIKCTSPCLSYRYWQDAGIKEAAHTMPAPEISVARPSVQDITLTKTTPAI